jgi:aminopeptidase N
MRSRHVCTFAAGAIALLSAPAAARADRLPAGVVPSHYDLAFTVDLARARFEGVETIRVDIEQPTRTVVLHALEISFGSVTITAAGTATQTASVTPNEPQQTATLTVSRTLPKGAADIRIAYAGILNDKLRGFYLSTEASGRRHAVTQFEATDARRAFPGFDEPAFKATFDVSLTIDSGDTAISNGRVVSDTPAADGRHTVRFATTPKMSTYLVALAVGRFECLEASAQNTPIRICSTQGKKELGRTALEMAGQLLTFYNQYFAIKYPFGKLDVLAVPDFAAGAMENTAAIFYREVDLLVDPKDASLATRKRIASVLAHEMAHQWFGDLVTMKWWDDIWLNEGFATWMEGHALAAMHPEWNVSVDAAIATQTALSLDGLTSTHAIHAPAETPAQIDEAFDAIAYEKGAAVLRMLEAYLGPETFRKGINAYLDAHAYGNGTSQDFWTAMAATSGKPIDRILPTFVNQPGAPLIDITPACGNGGTQVAAAQQRFFLDPALLANRSSELWQVPLCVKSAGSAAAPRDGAPSCDVLSQPRQSLTIDRNACSPWVFANPGAEGYYRTAYSPEALRTLAPRVQEVLTAPERLSLIGDEWALVRAGRHGVGEYLTLAAGFGNERTDGVLSDIAERLDFIHEYLATGASRLPFERFVRTLLGHLFQQVGFEPAPADGDEARALRATLIETLGTTGGDPDLPLRARAALDRALSGGTPLEPTLAGAIIAVAAEHGDRALQDALLTASDRAAAPAEHYRYLYALARFHDPPLIDRALEYSLTSKLRSQDAPGFLARFLRQEEARPRTWAFLKQHWADLEGRVTIFGGDTTIASALGAFCDATSRDDIRTFFAAHPLPSASRTLDQTIERIDNCIVLRGRQAPALVEWLRRQ